MIIYYQSGIQFILKWNAVHIKVTGINLTPKQKKNVKIITYRKIKETLSLGILQKISRTPSKL